MNVFKMAWRNVLRNRRRSVVTIAAMAFALFVELLYAGLIPGYLRAMEEDITQLEIGDVQIHAEGYRETPSIYTAIPDPDAVTAKLDALEGYPSAARLLGGGLAASGEFSAGIMLRAVDVERDLKVCKVAGKVAKGAWLDPANPKGVVVGKHLARTLAVEPGSEVLLLSQATDGSMANDLYEVVGVLGSVAEATDRATIYMVDDAFRDLMVMPTGAHQIVVSRPRTASAAEAGDAVAAAVGEDLEVKNWKQLMPIIAQMLDSVNGIIYILYFIIYVAVGILVLNAMLMAVFERIKEFGVLKAIGAGPLRVLFVIFIEAAIQTMTAMAIGFAAALPGMWWLSNKGIDFGNVGGMNVMGVSMRKIWYGIYEPSVLAGPVIMLVVIVGMAVLYPAIKAAWISPVEAMRHR
ncbi:MAG: ABC transporter permease [Deltaproteobacteria bacterium]|nr:ABC transporter permease [Deltaproteobacteria bacterium]